MKKIFVFLSFLFFCQYSNAQEAFTIKHYNIDLKVNKDASLDFTETIDVYFQKSQKFLYPLVGVGCRSIMPTQTFIAWDHFSKLDFRLISVFDQQTSCSEDDIKDFQYFSEHFLKPNKFFQENFLLETREEVFVFNLEEYSEDWIHFLRGKYSLFSVKAKKKIPPIAESGIAE